MSYCVKCGNQIPEDAMFCTKCGTPVVKDDESGIKQVNSNISKESNMGYSAEGKSKGEENNSNLVTVERNGTEYTLNKAMIGSDRVDDFVESFKAGEFDDMINEEVYKHRIIAQAVLIIGCVISAMSAFLPFYTFSIFGTGKSITFAETADGKIYFIFIIISFICAILAKQGFVAWSVFASANCFLLPFTEYYSYYKQMEGLGNIGSGFIIGIGGFVIMIFGGILGFIWDLEGIEDRPNFIKSFVVEPVKAIILLVYRAGSLIFSVILLIALVEINQGDFFINNKNGVINSMSNASSNSDTLVDDDGGVNYNESYTYDMSYVNSDSGYLAGLIDGGYFLQDSEKEALLETMKTLTEYGNVAYVTTSEDEYIEDTVEYAENTFEDMFGENEGNLLILDGYNNFIYLYNNQGVSDDICNRIIDEGIGKNNYYACSNYIFKSLKDELVIIG